ncbi:MAG: hypothetical protein D6805_05855 [Planctomycetota bacterium]|nr:MAG: hypothetical protein D6805_05855 [Planctomycetota bacterium]
MSRQLPRIFSPQGELFFAVGGTLFEKSVPPTTPSQKLLRFRGKTLAPENLFEKSFSDFPKTFLLGTFFKKKRFPTSKNFCPETFFRKKCFPANVSLQTRPKKILNFRKKIF